MITAEFSTLLLNYSTVNASAAEAAQAQFVTEFVTNTWQTGLLLTLGSFVYSMFVSVSHKVKEEQVCSSGYPRPTPH